MFEVLGYIFTVIVIVYAIVNIVMKILNCFREVPLETIVINHGTYWASNTNGLYIIPTISLAFGTWFEISFQWLYLNYYISFHIESEDEREEKWAAVHEYRKQKQND